MRSIATTSVLAAAAVVGFAAAPAAYAGPVYGFNQCVTNNRPGDVAIGFAQMTVELNMSGTGVDFTFRNSGPLASSITDLYWDDGSLLALGLITDGPGTDFGTPASPPDLPGGQNANPPFQTTAGFSADSNPPAQPNGVNPGEFVTVHFSLQAGRSTGDVISELASGELRIGIHVQGYASGGSEAFINNPNPVPAPAGVSALALAGLAAARRRRR